MSMETKTPLEVLLKVTGCQRLFFYRPFFALFMLVGFIAAIYTLTAAVCDLAFSLSTDEPPTINLQDRQGRGSSEMPHLTGGLFASMAFAAQGQDNGQAKDPEPELGSKAVDGKRIPGSQLTKTLIVCGIYLLLASVLLISLRIALTSKVASQVSTAGDFVKTLLGFFIGAGTGYI